MSFLQILHHFAAQTLQSFANIILDIGKRRRRGLLIPAWRAPKECQMEGKPRRKRLHEPMTNKPIAFAQKPPNPVAADCPALPLPDKETGQHRLLLGRFPLGQLHHVVFYHNGPLAEPFPLLEQGADRLVPPKDCRAWQAGWGSDWLLGIHCFLGTVRGSSEKICGLIATLFQRKRGLRSLLNDHNPRSHCSQNQVRPVASHR